MSEYMDHPGWLDAARSFWISCYDYKQLESIS